MKKGKTKRKMRQGQRIGIAVALSAVILLFLALFFQVADVEVEGEARYQESQIVEMVLSSPLSSNGLLASLFLGRAQIEDVPFLDSYSVRLKSHDTICIMVKEKQAVGCFTHLGETVYFDRYGYFFEDAKRERDPSIPYYSTLDTEELTPAGKLSFDNYYALDTAGALFNFFQRFFIFIY